MRSRWRQGGGHGLGICAADDPVIPGAPSKRTRTPRGVSPWTATNAFTMAADSRHSSDAGDAHPDLDADPDPSPAVGVVEHLGTAKRRQRHTKVAVYCLGLLRTRHSGEEGTFTAASGLLIPPSPGSPAERIRGHIHEQFAASRPLPEDLEEVARLGAQLLMRATSGRQTT
jgi:hypothetical protein